MATQRPVVLETTNYELEVLLSTDVIDPTALGTSTANSAAFLRGDSLWSNQLVGNLSITSVAGSPQFSAIAVAGQNATFALAGNGNTVGTSDFILRQDASSIAQIVQRAAADLRIQVNGSERLRITSAGAWGLAGANYGTSGQVLTSAGSGNPPTWTTINPAVVAVAAGDTTPNPGITGYQAWSSTLGRPVYWDGTYWHPMASVSVGTTAPANPATGDIWIDTN